MDDLSTKHAWKCKIAVTTIFCVYSQVKTVFVTVKNIIGQRDISKQCVPVQMFWDLGPLVETFRKHNIPALKVLSNEKKRGVLFGINR